MNDIHEIEPMQTAGSGSDWRTTWTPSRRHFLTLTGLAVGGAALGLGVSACGTAQTGSSTGGQAKGRAGAAGETMFVAGFQWGPPKSFNPMAANPDWPTNVQAGNQSQFIYETLLRFNLLDGSLSPGIAKELQQPNDNTFVLPLQDGTKWSDGSDLTADDVVFTLSSARPRR
jgi:peptide/nickel transport system substrate-binding protein